MTDERIIREVKECVAVGEVQLAFDVLCSWLYEDELPISSAYHAELTEMAVELDLQKWVGRLRTLVRDE